MARRLLLTAALGLIVTGTGCVSREKYEAAQIELAAARESAAASEINAQKYRTEAEMLRDNQAKLAAVAEAAQASLIKTNEENALLLAQNQALQDKYRQAMERPPQVVMGAQLPPELNAALKELAAANQGIMEYDADRGMIKFKSDFTFPTSSDQLTPAARSAVQRLAGILNSPAARNFEFLVAGHTDNIPVSRPETIRAGHKDNWYLSTHRAVSVAKELMASKVSAERVGALGYGEQRPVANNATADGRAKNRRVEVLILPTTVRSAGSTAGLTGNTPPKRAEPALNKDTAVDLRDQEPVLGK
jgi:chemotaxis protein MotB